MAWGSKHSQPLPQIFMKGWNLRLVDDVVRQTEPDTPIGRFPSPWKPQKMQQFNQETQIDDGAWENVVTRKADPIFTPFLDNVIHDFAQRIFNHWDKQKSRLLTHSEVLDEQKHARFWSFSCPGQICQNGPCPNIILDNQRESWEGSSTYEFVCSTFLGSMSLESGSKSLACESRKTPTSLSMFLGVLLKFDPVEPLYARISQKGNSETFKRSYLSS